MSDGANFNPYSAPIENHPVAEEVVVFRPRPCPRCQGENSLPTPYSRWHGRRAPKAIQDVTCQDCGANFDGVSGIEYPRRKSPLVWFLIAVMLFVMYVTFVVVVPFL